MSTTAEGAGGADIGLTAGDRPAAPPAEAGRGSAGARISLSGLRAKARGILGRSVAFDGAAASASVRRPRRPWRGFRFRAQASLGEATVAVASPAGLDAGEARPTPAQQRARAKKSWREQRWERRRKRRFVEEVIGWIVVPIIIISGYYGVKSGLNALGTTPTALIQNVKTAISSRS